MWKGRPLSRLLDAHDANSLNVLIPLDAVTKGPGCCEDYYTYNGDTITVQSLVTGQMLRLHVVGEYDTSDGVATPLFGKILADDSVVRALSRGNPSYAYELRLDATQRRPCLSACTRPCRRRRSMISPPT